MWLSRTGVSSAGRVSKPSGTSQVDVGAVLDQVRFGRVPTLVVTLTTLTLIFDGFDIQAIAFAGPSLLAQWRIDHSTLAPVLAAGLLGMGVGALWIGTLGDRFGRRQALIGSMVLVALTSLLSAWTTNPMELAVCRFFTGIGLGGSLPNAAALVAEFVPPAFRTLALAVTAVGGAVGGMVGSAVAAELIPAYGWPSIFLAGAILPALLAGVMMLALPESPRFLAIKGNRPMQLAEVLNRLTGSAFDGTEQFVMHESAAPTGRGVVALFAPSLRYDTLMIWLVFFTSVFAVYAIFSWLPTVLTVAGLPLQTAIRGSIIFNLGGMVGALFAAAAINRFGSRPVLIFCAIGAILSAYLLGYILQQGGASSLALSIAMATAGVFIASLQVGMYPVAAHTYTTENRACGMGWALGIARGGGIVSSFAGSALLSLTGGPSEFFRGIAMALIVALVAILLMRSHMPRLRA